MPSRKGNIRRVHFNRTKYGRELLVDVAWIHDIPTFILDEPHVLDFYDIVLITRGRGMFFLDGEAMTVRPRRIFFTAPGQVRRWTVSKLDGICLFFPDIFLAEFFRDARFVERLPYFGEDAARAIDIPAAAATSLRHMLEGMRKELRPARADSVHLLRAALYEILIKLVRLHTAKNAKPVLATTHPAVRRYQELIEQNFRRVHRTTDYARRLSISAGHLNALCNEHLGRSAKHVLQERIAVEARRLLLYTDDTAESIGRYLGFVDASYFGRFFRRVAGVSPRSFRRPARVASSMF